jgi:hypothetical protein
MIEVSRSETPLRTTFNIKLNGKTTAIATVGQAYQFITSLNSVEWMEYRAQHDAAVAALKARPRMRYSPCRPPTRCAPCSSARSCCESAGRADLTFRKRAQPQSVFARSGLGSPS